MKSNICKAQYKIIFIIGLLKEECTSTGLCVLQKAKKKQFGALLN